MSILFPTRFDSERQSVSSRAPHSFQFLLLVFQSVNSLASSSISDLLTQFSISQLMQILHFDWLRY